MDRKIFVIFLLFTSILHGFHLRDYDAVAIATDMLPDDVMALHLLLNTQAPIQLISVENEEQKALFSRFFPGEIEINNGLQEFVDGASHPLLIQLSPPSELLHLQNAEHLDVICYGGHNLRKAASLCYDNFSSGQQQLVDELSEKCHRLAVLESYGVMGPNTMIEVDGADPFFQLFRQYVVEWNQMMLETKLTRAVEHINLIVSGDLSPSINLQRDLHFLASLKGGQSPIFSAADVLVALALIDEEDLFKTELAKLTYDNRGYLLPMKVKTANTYVYKQVQRETIERLLLSYIQ